MTAEPLRLAGALALSLGWLGLSYRMWRTHRNSAAMDVKGADWLVVHASQTGSAEMQTARACCSSPARTAKATRPTRPRRSRAG
ncbi:hypothetical protein ACEN88_20710 [Massilia sp. CT11-108]|uniref:hypothetical protein n=1 Tax=Massilia sp. CT11-108 TaxID=3393900 RepID=UPI0039A5657F